MQCFKKDLVDLLYPLENVLCLAVVRDECKAGAKLFLAVKHEFTAELDIL